MMLNLGSFESLLSRVVGPSFSGLEFTWCNNHLGGARVWKKIDKTFATASRVQLYPNHQMRHLLRIGFDHCLVLVMTETRFSY